MTDLFTDANIERIQGMLVDEKALCNGFKSHKPFDKKSSGFFNNLDMLMNQTRTRDY